MSEIIINAVGDISLGDHPACVGFGVYSKLKNKEKDFPFVKIKPLLKQADIVFGNLECALFDNKTTTHNLSSLQMKGERECVYGLVESGFTMLNVANNHTMQHGEEPFLKTVKLLKENYINVCGVESDKFISIEKRGIKVGFLGYSMRPRQYFNKQPLYCEATPDKIYRNIQTFKTQVSSLIVSLHWGDEFIEKPSPEEIKWARTMIDCGANLILGHHPHVLRGIESYKNGVIVYSLGNFVCDMIWEERTRESMILKCIINKDGVVDFRIIPVFINNDFQPTPCDTILKDKITEKINRLSRELEQEKLINFSNKLEHYISEREIHLQTHRKNTHSYFIKNIFRYKPKILFEEIYGAILRRIQTLTHTNDKSKLYL